MGAFQPWHWIIVLAVVLLVFARPGKLSGLMGDAAKGIKAFKEGLKSDPDAEKPAKPVPTVEGGKD